MKLCTYLCGVVVELMQRGQAVLLITTAANHLEQSRVDCSNAPPLFAGAVNWLLAASSCITPAAALCTSTFHYCCQCQVVAAGLIQGAVSIPCWREAAALHLVKPNAYATCAAKSNTSTHSKQHVNLTDQPHSVTDWDCDQQFTAPTQKQLQVVVNTSCKLT